MAVEKLAQSEFAKIGSRQEALQTISPNLLDIFYHPIFDCFQKNRVFQQPPLFATSLTKSATSRVFDSFFVPFAQTPALRSPLFPSAGDAPQFSVCSYCPTYETRFVSLHRLGVAHQTSLRSLQTMMMYSNSPQWGRRVAHSVNPVTTLQDHCCDQASPPGHYRFPAAPFRDGRTLRN